MYNNWISFENFLPTELGEYLVYGKCTDEKLQIDIATWNGKAFNKYMQPTHWQPLPPAPKQD